LHPCEKWVRVLVMTLMDLDQVEAPSGLRKMQDRDAREEINYSFKPPKFCLELNGYFSMKEFLGRRRPFYHTIPKVGNCSLVNSPFNRPIQKSQDGEHIRDPPTEEVGACGNYYQS
jgi:hypothetical protein